MIHRIPATIAALGLLALPAVAEAAPRSVAVGQFIPGQTDGLRPVSGSVTFTQVGNGTITVTGRLSGLEPSKGYVAVPYKDAMCLPTPGITAFPTGAFYTDSTGRVRIPAGVTVNPQAINPTGQFTVQQTKSVSVRQIVISAVNLPGIPAGTPTVPNVVRPEACDVSPDVH